jgi:2-methylcitrate dehydratase PrpD
MSDVTERVAAFIRATPSERFSAPALEAARQAFLDTVAVAVAGHDSAAGRRIVGYASDQESRPVATILGADLRTSAELAALANGTLAHALDFDDTNHILDGHSSAHLVPAVLAASESLGSGSYRRCLEAYLVGYQVETAIGRALNPEHFRSGFHPTGTIATIGAAAAVARLWGLSHEESLAALGIAASSAAGLRANVGTMTKPLHAGSAAANGVRAASLAQHGWDATREAIEGRYGFAVTHDGGREPRYGELLSTLDGEWAVLLGAALVVKPFPCCAGTHPAIEAAQQLREQGLDAEAIESVRVRVGDVLPTVLVHDRPRTGNEAKFSLRYTLARALVAGDVRIADFHDEALANPLVQRMMDRIEVVVEDPGLGVYGVGLTVRESGGRELRAAVADARVESATPVSEARLLAKLTDCLGGDSARARGVWAAFAEGRDESPVAELIEAVAPVENFAHH